MRLFLLLLFFCSTASGQPPMPPSSWKCGRNIPGGIDGPYNIFMGTSCNNLQGEISQCCANFKNCKGDSCVDDHEKCNANSIRGRERECAKIVTHFVQRENRKLSDMPPETWKCELPNLPGGNSGTYNKLLLSSCSDLKDNINQCCIVFKNCIGDSCVDDHERCNANAIFGRESECAKIVTYFVQRENRKLPRYPPETWKCVAPKLQGGTDGPYFELMKSVCADLQNNINQCCINFDNCKGDACVDDHEKCNNIAILGRARECAKIVTHFVQRENRPLPRWPPETWKCEGNHLNGGIDGPYFKLMKSLCADIKDNINACCFDFKNCQESKLPSCVDKHKTCNKNAIQGREKQCFAIADGFVQKDDPLPPTKDFACQSQGMGGVLAVHRSLLNGVCKDLTDSLSDCCAVFNKCDEENGFDCVGDHEKCNNLMVSHREQECIDLAGKLIRNDRRRLPDKDWKCRSKSKFKGAWEQDYRDLVRGNCYNLKDRLNQCCVNFDVCSKNNGDGCISQHEKCNAGVISGRSDCSAIADRFVQHETPRPDKGFACHSKLPGGANAVYRSLYTGNCADLTDPLIDCCAVFNKCDEENGHFCVEEHEKCNDRVVSGRKQECIDLAGKLIRNDRRQHPDKDWKCNAAKNLPGAREQSYRNVVSGICSNLKDKLNECCAKFDVCTKNNGDGCISQHEKCNAGVITGRERDCYAIADSLVNKEPSHPDKGFACHSKLPGGAIAVYRSLYTGNCADLTDPLSDCCAVFNKCDEENEHFCVEDHEKCNDRVVSGREQECIDLAGKLIRNDRRQHPDKDWKCRSNSNLLGAWEQDYRDLVGGNCYNLKDRLNQCCMNFDVCSQNKGDGCVSQHEKCNAEVISGREKTCSTFADRFIQRDKPDPKPDAPKPRGQIIVYFETVIVYAQEQMETHPFRFWMGIALIIFATLLLLCGTCFLCCAVLGKRREEERKNQNSSPRASSVKSDSGRN